ncbi:MAG: CPBP family glutamic-type intramembrane protease [Candidatus Verstraetearchaeota archaeon]|nr:CPBP family glutamic-type intramembrane protease [Candidatus Verstraetearchaeota archaeon]
MSLAMAHPENAAANSDSNWINYKRLIASFYGILALLIIGTYILAFILALSMFFSSEGAPFADQSYKAIKINVLYFWIVSIQIEARAWQIFLVLNFVFALSFLSAFFSNKRFCAVTKDLFVKGNLNEFQRNFLILMPGISSAMLLITTALNVLGERAGVGVGGPSFANPFSEIFTLSFAVISEEIGFRLVPILVPTAVYLLLKSRNSIRGMPKRTKIFMIATAVLKPESYRCRLGVESDQRFTVLKTLLILVSSLMFSYAHILFGSWGWGKLPSTFIAGLVIGYFSVKYGFDSAILLHWFFNYYWSALSLATGIGAPFSLINELAYVVTVYLGLFTLIYLLFGFLGKKYNI